MPWELAFMIWEGTMQAFQGEKQLIVPLSYNAYKQQH